MFVDTAGEEVLHQASLDALLLGDERLGLLDCLVDSGEDGSDLGLFSPTSRIINLGITLAGYLELLNVIAELELIRSVALVQLTIRLLIPPGSRLLELSEARALVGPLDEAALVYPWSNPNPEADTLHTQVRALVQQGATKPNDQIFGEIWKLAHERAGRRIPFVPGMGARVAPAQLSEP